MLAKLRATTTSNYLNSQPKPAEIHAYKVDSTDGEPLFKIVCQYRPTQLNFAKGATWGAPTPPPPPPNSETPQQAPPPEPTQTPTKDVPPTTFQGGSPGTLTLNLLFDTTETGADVRDTTKLLFKLVYKVSKDPVDQPPLCRFKWGVMTSFLACVTSVSVTYTLFKGDGTPIRAEAQVQLREYEDEKWYDPQNPTSQSIARKTWVVEEGQRLDWIAYKEYGSPRYWRHIAEVNNLSDPGDIYPGKILKLTPLPPEE